MMTRPVHGVCRDTPSHPEQGQALVGIIILLVVLLVVAISYTSFVRSDLTNTGTVADIAQARSLAQAGIADAEFRVDNSPYYTGGTIADGSTSLTVPGAAFTSAVVGLPIDELDGSGMVPAGTTISAVVNATTVTLSNPVSNPNGQLLSFSIPGGPLTSFCGGLGCSTGPAMPANQGFSYVAHRSATGFVITSQGDFRGRRYTLQESYLRRSDFQFAYYGVQQLTFTGGGIGGAESYPIGVGQTCSSSPHFSNGGTPTVVYGSLAASTCSNLQQGQGAFDPQPPQQTCAGVHGNTPPTPCIPAYAPVISKCNFSMSSTVAPGIYVCTGSSGVQFGSALDVAIRGLQVGSPRYCTKMSGANAPQVQIWDFSSANPPLDWAGSHNTVRLDQACGAGVAGDNPDALAIYDGESDSYSFPGTHAPQANAVFYGPQTQLDDSGGHLQWYGSMILDSYTGDGQGITFGTNLSTDSRLNGYWSAQASCQVPQPIGSWITATWTTPYSC